MKPLATRFGAGLGVPAQQLELELQQLERALEEVLARCRAAWPGLADDAGFVEHLARRRFTAASLREPFDAGPQVCDLYLAWACGQGDRRALQHLEATVLTEVRRTVARIKLPDGLLVEDVVQRVRERALLPRANAGPAILDYEGTGPLLNWLRTAAIRVVVTESNKGRAIEAEEDALVDLPFPGHHPELALIRQRFRASFREAFAEAIAELPDEDKNLLRLSYLDRVSVDRLGVLFGVNKSTISRRLEKTRNGLLERTRASLQAKLKMPAAELSSLLRLIDASLEVSIPAALFDAGDAGRNK